MEYYLDELYLLLPNATIRDIFWLHEELNKDINVERDILNKDDILIDIIDQNKQVVNVVFSLK